MVKSRGLTVLYLAGTALTGFGLLGMSAKAAPLITGTATDSSTVVLPGDLSHAVRVAKDEGIVAAATALPHIRLELKRPAALQAALDRLVHDQQTKGSARYHHWLKPADLRGYGPDQADIDRVTTWLQGRGLTVNSVSRSGMEVDFGGSGASVARAFHTSLHNIVLKGESHIANVTAPLIPAELAAVVTGVTLHNVFPVPAMQRITPNFTTTGAAGTYYAVAPADFATIYNVNPLRGSANEFGQPLTGAGVTLAVVEQTDILPFDWNRFRSKFGLSGYPGTLTLTHPGSCTNPKFTPDEFEAALDAEWSSAVAPSAAIIEASCASVAPLYFGVETALQNLVEGGTSATIFSISYEGNELFAGYGFTAGWNNLLEEGAAEGIAIFVAAGDNGVSADRNEVDGDGLFVNGLADSAYNVSVGGTDFLDGSQGTFAQYWRTKNSPTGGSAISYVPEIPWDNSCASSIFFKFEGFSSGSQFCNVNPDAGQPGVGGSGSQSIVDVKPDWQLTSIPGVPNDGVRDQPDVSLFAANGLWEHFYLACMSDASEGGSPCDYNNQSDLLGNAAGGTSFGSPAFAGIAALIQQALSLDFGQTIALGNPAPIFYKIAAGQYATPLGVAPCDATLGNQISTACTFYNVTAGNNSEPCIGGTPNCSTLKGAALGVGILKSPTIAGPAYHAGTGYNLATGLGSVNVTNLLYGYTGAY
jgi:pseudomonalisin